MALQVRDNGAIGEFFHAVELFAEAHGHAAVAQVVAESFDDLLVGEFEQAVALLDQCDAHAENGEHAGVLDSDDATTYDYEGAWQLGQVHDLVTVDDGRAIDGHMIG